MDISSSSEPESSFGRLKALLLEADEEMEAKNFKRFENTDQIFDEIKRRVIDRREQQ
jgi:hypothetical protein